MTSSVKIASKALLWSITQQSYIVLADYSHTNAIGGDSKKIKSNKKDPGYVVISARKGDKAKHRGECFEREKAHQYS